jgi:hypothetical protein
MLGSIDPPNKPIDLLPFRVGQTIIITDPAHPGYNRIASIMALTTTGILIQDTDGHYISLERDQITHFGEIQLW